MKTRSAVTCPQNTHSRSGRKRSINEQKVMLVLLDRENPESLQIMSPDPTSAAMLINLQIIAAEPTEINENGRRR